MTKADKPTHKSVREILEILYRHALQDDFAIHEDIKDNSIKVALSYLAELVRGDKEKIYKIIRRARSKKPTYGDLKTPLDEKDMDYYIAQEIVEHIAQKLEGK